MATAQPVVKWSNAHRQTITCTEVAAGAFTQWHVNCRDSVTCAVRRLNNSKEHTGWNKSVTTNHRYVLRPSR